MPVCSAVRKVFPRVDLASRKDGVGSAPEKVDPQAPHSRLKSNTAASVARAMSARKIADLGQP